VEVTQGRKELHCEELHDLLCHQLLSGRGSAAAPVLAEIASSNPAGCVDVLSLANVVCCQVKVSLRRASPSSRVCVVSECDLGTSMMRRPRPEYCC